MKWRKVTALALAAVMCISASACANGAQNTGNTTQAESPVNTTAESQTSAADNTTAAPGNDAGNQAALRVAWWGSQERHNMTIEALDAYTAEAGTEFSYEYTSWTSYFENLATQAVGSNLPDVIQMSTTDIINYSKNDQIIDLQPYIDDGTIDISNIDQSSLSGGMVDGKLAGFTTGVNTVNVLYDKEAFDQAGVTYPSNDWTWSQFIDTAKAVYDATQIPTELPFLAEARWLVEAMVRSYGYDFFSEDGQSLPWAEDETVVTAVIQAVQDIYDGVKAGYFVDPEVQIAWSTTEDYFIVKGESAMSFQLSNYYGVYCAAAGKELGMVMLPKMDGGSQTGMYLNSNMYWCISANCQDPKAAAAVINYLINDEDACKMIGTDRGISLSGAVREMLASSEDTDVYTKNTLNYVNEVSSAVKSTNPADPLNSAEAISVLKNNFTAAMYGEMSAEDCITDFISQAASILPE